jgi:hypothetical protein
MGLSEIVAELANALTAARQPLTHRERFLLHVLSGMPKYRDVSRLDLWETAYKEVIPDNDLSETEQIIDDIFSLGQYNLYGAFDAAGTTDCYNKLAARLAQKGLRLPPVQGVQDW